MYQDLIYAHMSLLLNWFSRIGILDFVCYLHLIHSFIHFFNFTYSSFIQHITNAVTLHFPPSQIHSSSLQKRYRPSVISTELSITRLVINPHIKAGQGNSRSKTVPWPGKESEITPHPVLARSSTKTSSWKNTAWMQKDWCRTMQALWLLLQSLWAPMSPA